MNARWHHGRRLPPFWQHWPYVIGQGFRYLISAAGLFVAIGEFVHGFPQAGAIIGGLALLHGSLTAYRSYLRG